ncbi:lipoate--protein ligase [Alkaliphilus crotonatoxidans]
MKFISNNHTDPHYNLALEEYVLKHLDPQEDFVILWQNRPSIIIGRNQNTMEEINAEYVKKNDISVVRRLSGGGAVYHDFGNLNFTFIVKNDQDSVSNYRKFTKPVIDALNRIGIPAEFSGRNDITIEGKKFSGNAQYYYRNKLLHHGTLLYHSELTRLQEALKVRADKISSKGIKSVRSRVTNIADYMDRIVPINEFRDLLLKYIFEYQQQTPQEYILTDQDQQGILEIMNNRYMTWNWNFGESPDFHIQKSKRFTGGLLDIRFDVQQGKISQLKIYGDFLSSSDVSGLEERLTGLTYEETAITDGLKDLELSNFLGQITLDELIECLFY